MDYNEKELAEKYRKNSKRAAWFLTIVVGIIGIVLISLGLYFMIRYVKENTVMLSVGIIMVILAVFDLYICVRFLRHTYKSMKQIPDRVAANKYLRIHGIKK